ncbi:MAG: hypothetical protein Q8K85_00380 [Hyphomicrobium sp.]|nr:hypothetical protein [Hyphomicrobium sp.]
MKRTFLAAASLLALSQAAFASANLDCTIKDKNAELTIEAITSRDGKYLDNMRGELRLATGEKVEFDKSSVKSYSWDKNVAFVIAKQTPQGPFEIRIFAKPKDEIDFEGTYTLTVGKTKKTGKVQCSGG